MIKITKIESEFLKKILLLNSEQKTALDTLLFRGIYHAGASTMHLTYRGINYHPSTETSNLEMSFQPQKTYRSVRFQTYKGQAQVPKLGIQLTYRGARYTI